jgi:hypothetical protein
MRTGIDGSGALSRGWAIRSGEDRKRGLRDTGNGAEVAVLVDAVLCEEGCIVKHLFPDTDPAQLVTDYFYLFYGILHKVMFLLAGDTIKRCIKTPVLAPVPEMSRECGTNPHIRLIFWGCTPDRFRGTCQSL